MSKKKHPDYPNTLAECREAAKDNTPGYSMEFESVAFNGAYENPLSKSGTLNWEFLLAQTRITVHQCAYMLTVYGRGPTMEERQDRIMRTITALQSDETWPPYPEYIDISRIPELAVRAGVDLPREWRSAGDPRHYAIFMDLVEIAVDMIGEGKNPNTFYDLADYFLDAVEFYQDSDACQVFGNFLTRRKLDQDTRIKMNDTLIRYTSRFGCVFEHQNVLAAQKKNPNKS